MTFWEIGALTFFVHVLEMMDICLFSMRMEQGRLSLALRLATGWRLAPPEGVKSAHKRLLKVQELTMCKNCGFAVVMKTC